MQIFLLALLLAVCDGQVTTNHKTMPAGSSCIPDHPVHKEVKILKEQVLRTDAKLQEMKETYQSQHGKFPLKCQPQLTKFDTLTNLLLAQQS